MDLGELIRTARDRRGMSQRELSEKSGISESVISRLEKGLTEGRSGTVGRLAAALDIDPALVTEALSGQELNRPERSPIAEMIAHELSRFSEADQRFFLRMIRAFEERTAPDPGGTTTPRGQMTEKESGVWGLVPVRVPELAYQS